jgi:hypothetical protein
MRKEHAGGYTLEQALRLARNLKHGPLPAPGDPTPPPREALSIIEEERRACRFNWITGETAAGVIRAHLAAKD